jgi:CheY-like chemotaxis protein
MHRPHGHDDWLQGTEVTSPMASDGRVDPATTTEDVTTRQQRIARSVLVVDDDPGVLGVVSRILRRAGGDVATASNGREALRLIAGGRVNPGLLVTDIDMPGMTGIELAARVAAMRPGTRIVMMTGDALSAAAARKHVGLVEAVLLKPVTIDELLEAIGWR